MGAAEASGGSSLFGFAHVVGGFCSAGGTARRAPPATARVAWLPTYSAYGVCNSKWKLVTAVSASVERAVDSGTGWQRVGRTNGAGTEEPEAMSTARSRTSSLSRLLPATDLSLDTERSNVRVAYQGSPGTVMEAMVLKAFPECIAVPYKKFEWAFQAVDSSLADIVVLPIENSSTGSYHQNHDLLLSQKLYIVEEVQMNVDLCLLALPGVEKEDLRRILSHTEELAQCEHSLSDLGVTKKNVDHGAAGAEIISMQNLRDAGVIGSARVAELYGLNILECNFQDASPNLTRYLLLAKTASTPKEYGQYKTSIVFGLEGPGILYKALGTFWKREISLTKIESRPDKGKPMRTQGTEKQFNYIFYADFEASMAEARAQNALRDLEEIATFLRVLGCYPTSTTLKSQDRSNALMVALALG